MLSQTNCNISFFFLVLNTKEDILKNMGKQTATEEERNSFRFKTKLEWVNDGINIKHYDRIDRQMMSFLFFNAKKTKSIKK